VREGSASRRCSRPCAPRANAVAERLVGTLRRECFDHLIVLNERHLRAVLAEFAAYDNAARPHRALALDTPKPAPRPRHGPIRASPSSADSTTRTNARHRPD